MGHIYHFGLVRYKYLGYKVLLFANFLLFYELLLNNILAPPPKNTGNVANCVKQREHKN